MWVFIATYGCLWVPTSVYECLRVFMGVYCLAGGDAQDRAIMEIHVFTAIIDSLVKFQQNGTTRSKFYKHQRRSCFILELATRPFSRPDFSRFR